MASRRLTLVTFAVVVVAGALALFLPALAKTRDVLVATPAAPPLLDVTPVPLPPRQSVCIGDVTLDPAAAIVRFQRVSGAAPAAVRVSVRGSSGYSANATATVAPPPANLDIPLTPRPASAQTGTVCLRNEGSPQIRLVASTEPRSDAAARATIAGRPLAAHVALQLLAQPRSSLLARAPRILSQASAFRPGWLGRTVLWVLLIAVVIGVPAGIAAALKSARGPAAARAPDPGAAAQSGKTTP